MSTLRYIVLHLTIDQMESPIDGTDELEEEDFPDVKDMILCKDFVDVEMALQKAEKKMVDWSVWEIIDKPAGPKSERRAVVFNPDGKTIRSIQ